MRFTDNAELTAANMTDTDILAGTDVSAQTDKKFSLAGLADWFLNRFTGLSLAGQNQSVKAALDGLNSTMGVLQNQSVYMGAAGTKEIDLTLGQYIVTIGKFNATNVAYSGLYIVTAHSSQSSVLAVASSGGATVSVSGLKLTITTTQTYMTASITKVSTNTNT